MESGHRVEWTEETNYMFRLSAFKSHLREWLQNGKLYIFIRTKLVPIFLISNTDYLTDMLYVSDTYNENLSRLFSFVTINIFWFFSFMYNFDN